MAKVSQNNLKTRILKSGHQIENEIIVAGEKAFRIGKGYMLAWFCQFGLVMGGNICLF